MNHPYMKYNQNALDQHHSDELKKMNVRLNALIESIDEIHFMEQSIIYSWPLWPGTKDRVPKCKFNTLHWEVFNFFIVSILSI